MKKNLLSIIIFLSILIICPLISASRLPVVGQDNSTWGEILNDYLMNLAGPFGTVLNQTIVNNLININGMLSGAGTEGYIAMFNGTNSLNSSIIFQNGSYIGIGTTNPTETLEVNGSIKFYPSADSAKAFRIGKADGTTEILKVDSDKGRVIIIGNSSAHGAHALAVRTAYLDLADGAQVDAYQVTAYDYSTTSNKHYVIGGQQTAYSYIGTGVTNTGYLNGFTSYATHRGAGTIDLAMGGSIEGGTEVAGGGLGDGTINNLKVLRLLGYKSPASTINNAYGLWINNIQGTNAWDIYANDTNAKNYFAGNVSIGNEPTASNTLRVAGDVNVSGMIYYNNGTPVGSGGGSGNIEGAGEANQVAFFNATHSVTGSPNITYGGGNLILLAPGQTSNVAVYGFSDDSANRPTFQLQRGRKTDSSGNPSLTVKSGDSLGAFFFSGYDATTPNPQPQGGAALQAFVDGDPTVGGVPTRLSFVTGSNFNDRKERLTIKSDGKIGIGTTTPYSTLDVYKSNSADESNYLSNFAIKDLVLNDQTRYHWAIQGVADAVVATGKTESGQLGAIVFDSWRNHINADSDDSGVLSKLYGITAQYGHYDTNPLADPQTIDAYGIFISPYYKSGNIENLYDIYLGRGVGIDDGTKYINRYGIYQASNALNFFNGSIAIGGEDPYHAVDVALYINHTRTQTAGSLTSMWVDTHLNPTGNSQASGIAFTAQAQYTATPSGYNLEADPLSYGYNSAGLSGFYGGTVTDTSANPSSVVTAVVGTSGQNLVRKNSKVTSAYGVLSLPVSQDVGSGGQITNSYAFYARGEKGPVATIGNSYGLYVEPRVGTNKFGIYQAGADDVNYFAGDVKMNKLAGGGTGYACIDNDGKLFKSPTPCV